MSMGSGPPRRGKPKIASYFLPCPVIPIASDVLMSVSVQRPPKRTGPETSIKDTWTKLAGAIKEIQNHNASKLSFEEHYRYAYNMVLYKHGDQLYNGVKGLIVEHLEQLAEEKIVPTFPRTGSSYVNARSNAGGSSSYVTGGEAIERAMEGDRFLKAVKGVWEDHTGSMRKLKDILKYMDKVHTEFAGVPKIYDVGLTLFLSHIIRSSKHPLHSHLMSTLLSQVQLERDGEAITRSTVRECVDILLRLNSSEREGGVSVYMSDFEPEFLRQSAEFYEDEAFKMLEKGDAGLYIRNVERRLTEEADRTNHYLSTLTHPAIQSILVDRLLSRHLQAILDMPGSGLVSMIDSDRVQDLHRIYTLFNKVPEDVGKRALKISLRSDIEERGKGVNEAAVNEQNVPGPSGLNGAAQDNDGMDQDEDPKAVDKGSKGKGKPRPPGAGTQSATLAGALSAAVRWVQDVLDLKDKFDRLLDQAFEGDKAIQGAINEAFQSFINANTRAPEFLSLYIDEHLKKGTKAKSDDEIELALEKTIILFRFLHDKDKFERYYKMHLARRLLYARSASDDAEKGMVAKLKVEMGFQFTQKLEGMFTDMRISAESATTFRNYQTRHGSAPFELTVNVLTASYWPQLIAQTSSCSFSHSSLVTATGIFQKYYDSRHSGRRLTWQGNLGTADVKVRFRNRSHDLNVSTQALVVLLLFEELQADDVLGYSEIKSATDLSDPDLVRTLQSLACGKFRILTKHPKGRDVNPNDTFSFNEAFTSPLARIKIMQVASKVESTKEREETQEMVDEERKHMVEACIVRVMKNRKQLPHNDLISEVAHQLSTRFNPSMSMIKKRIEGLIDREYLERTGDIGTYRYLA